MLRQLVGSLVRRKLVQQLGVLEGIKLAEKGDSRNPIRVRRVIEGL
jgi:hypothetical protein